MHAHYDSTLCLQEMEQKQSAERQLVLERQQAEASNEELQRKLEELNQQLQEKRAQVHVYYVALYIISHTYSMYLPINDYRLKY